MRISQSIKSSLLDWLIFQTVEKYVILNTPYSKAHESETELQGLISTARIDLIDYSRLPDGLVFMFAFFHSMSSHEGCFPTFSE